MLGYVQLRHFIAAVIFFVACGPALAEGDPVRGEREFRRMCTACHTIEPGGAPKLGPNLYGIMGRSAASVSGARYSTALREAGQNGLIWDERSLMAYMSDPTAFLVKRLGRSDAKSGKTFKVVNPQAAYDVTAYLLASGAAP